MARLRAPLLLPTTQECEIAANKSLIQIRKRAALSAGKCVPSGMFGVLGSHTGPFKPTMLPRLQLLTLNQSEPSHHCTPFPKPKMLLQKQLLAQGPWKAPAPVPL